jgi:hypothetical protein
MGQKWLDAKFEERLAAYRHAQQRELEQLKFEINTLMDRMVRLHQREFDVLPEAWGRLNDAFQKLEPVALGFQQYPDVSRMPDNQLDELLDKSPLANWQKTELRSAHDRTRYYADAMAWHILQDAGGAYNDFRDYFHKNGIFISESIKDKFSEIEDMMLHAYIERRLSLQYRDQPQKFDKGQILHTDGPRLLKTLEQDVQSRLWSVKTAEGV